MSKTTIIKNEQALRDILPAYPAIMDKRIKPELDTFSLEFINQASVAVLAFNQGGIAMEYLDLKASNFMVSSNNRLQITLPDNTTALNTNRSHCSLYFLIPGVGHGLRVNGHTMTSTYQKKTQQQSLSIFIDQVYVHCSRAIVRSGLWKGNNQPVYEHDINLLNNMKGSLNSLTEDSRAFIKYAPVLFLKTQDQHNCSDLSPRGDPVNIANIIDNKTLLIAERAGNKVAKSMRNILINPYATISFLIPGVVNSLTVSGTAQVTSCPEKLTPLTIDKKTPKLGILIHVDNVEFNPCPGLSSSDLWNPKKHINEKSLTPFSKVLSYHMNGTGLLGKASSPIIGAIVRHDLKNLY